MKQEKIWDFHQANLESEASIFEGSSARYRYLAGLVSPGARVLNIGVGLGDLEKRLLEKGCESFSLDPSAKAIARMREVYGMGERAQVGYSQSMPFDDNQFDVLIMSEVLEHLDDETLSATLSEVRRTLADGGCFLGTVPADERLADSICVCPCCGEQFHRWGHVQSFTDASLRSRLGGLFDDLTIERRYFTEARSLNWKGKLSRWIKLGLLTAGRHGANETFVFQGTRP